MPARKKTRGAGESRAKILRIAREQFGFDGLREGQEEAVASIASGRDTLVVQPTGSGKSAIYQIAGLMINGPTVIVSPLIALQKDQIDSIRESDIADAAVVNSQQRVGELRETFERLEGGKVEFLFLSPEQLSKDETREKVFASKPSLFVIDEAHCISEWGHDFRPDYLKLGAVIEALGHPPVLAMTATASPAVREEIVTRLGMRDPAVIATGFDRPNIRLEARMFDNEGSKIDAMLEAVDREPKPGIIYVATRKNAEQIAGAVAERGVRAASYHGGMPAKERTAIQNGFMSGETEVIVATNAFGMGIDKADVRFVFHADVSDSIDSYYQEIGRAGRDGEPARAVLFYRPEDLNVQKFLNSGGQLEEKRVREVIELIQNGDGPADVDELKDRTNLSGRKLAKTINRLEEAGAVEMLESGEVAIAEDAVDLDQAARQAVEEQRRRRDFDMQRIEKMKLYAELDSCRREYLLQYFGEEDVPLRCDNCDVCDSAPAEEETGRPEAERFRERSRVVHRELGRGVVESREGDKIVIVFDEVGRKTLLLSAVEEQGLLQPAL